MKVSGVQCCFYFFSIRGIFFSCTLNYYFVIRNDFQKINLDWINHWMIQSELKKNVCKEFQCNVSLLNLKNKQVACFKVMSGFVIMTPEWKHTCFTFNILSCEQFSGLHKRDIIHMRNIHTWSCKKVERKAWSVIARSPRVTHDLSYPTLLGLEGSLFHYRFCNVNHRCALSVNASILPFISCILSNYSEHLWCE